MTPLTTQIVNLFASGLLLIAFAMLAQRRIVTLINLFALQGMALVCSTATVAYATGQSHLYWSAGITLVLKVIILPYILHRLIRRLNVKWDIETLINIPTMMLVGIALVVFAFNLALLWALPVLVAKLAAGGLALAVIETILAKMRIFRVPEFLATAFLLGVLALLVHLLLGA